MVSFTGQMVSLFLNECESFEKFHKFCCNRISRTVVMFTNGEAFFKVECLRNLLVEFLPEVPGVISIHL